jgi:hypothetical protein
MGMGEDCAVSVGCALLGGHPGDCAAGAVTTILHQIDDVLRAEPSGPYMLTPLSPRDPNAPQVTAPHTVEPERRTRPRVRDMASEALLRSITTGSYAQPPPRAAPEIDPSTLDPGIRRLVMHLRALGIPTTDSGDGVNKPADTRALDQPHVFAVYPRLDWRQALADADRVGALLPAREGSEISLAYNPHDQQLVLAIVGYGDGDLP